MKSGEHTDGGTPTGGTSTEGTPRDVLGGALDGLPLPEAGAPSGPLNESVLPMIFKRYPFVLFLRERYLPISKEKSFAMLPHFSTTEAEHALRREDVLNLIHQWLLARGLVKTAAQLSYDMEMEPWDLGLGSDVLVHLLQAAAPQASAVFGPVRGGGASEKGDADEDKEVVVNDDLGAVDAADSVWAENEPDADAPLGAPRTLGQICRLLVLGGASSTALRSVVASTWSAWTTPKDFLQCLFHLYDVPDDGRMGAEETAQFQIRVVRVVVWFVVAGGGPLELVSGMVSRFAARLFELGRSKNAAELRQGLF